MGAQVFGAAAPSYAEQFSRKKCKERSNEKKFYSMGDFWRSKAPFAYKRPYSYQKLRRQE